MTAPLGGRSIMMGGGSRYLITGGAGFIGSAFVDYILRREPEARVRVLDTLTYSGSLASLEDAAARPGFEFLRGDVCNPADVRPALRGVQYVINFAAQVAVDRAMERADPFVRASVVGAYTLLEESRRTNDLLRFVQVSTDEVYGPVDHGSCREDAPLRPRNPYAESKVAAELLAHGYFQTYGLPVNVTRAANTYGPRAHPEKVIPLFITNLIDGRPLPIYGDGRQVRDWLFVEDHCEAIYTVLHHGVPGETYNVAAGQECTNVELASRILQRMGRDQTMVRFVTDRPAHDRRYSITADKLSALGWRAMVNLDDGLARTVKWYEEHESWWRPLKRTLDERYPVGFWGQSA